MHKARTRTSSDILFATNKSRPLEQRRASVSRPLDVSTVNLESFEDRFLRAARCATPQDSTDSCHCMLALGTISPIDSSIEQDSAESPWPITAPSPLCTGTALSDGATAATIDSPPALHGGGHLPDSSKNIVHLHSSSSEDGTCKAIARQRRLQN
ncbi:hypothetical protein TgHK011_005081 [Trichoderma gracile]|nr:hypothetical protein TgHK011_005081 [Trichoderma gracile]